MYKYINDHTKTIAVNIDLPFFIFTRNIAESNSEELTLQNVRKNEDLSHC